MNESIGDDEVDNAATVNDDDNNTKHAIDDDDDDDLKDSDDDVKVKGTKRSRIVDDDEDDDDDDGEFARLPEEEEAADSDDDDDDDDDDEKPKQKAKTKAKRFDDEDDDDDDADDVDLFSKKKSKKSKKDKKDKAKAKRRKVSDYFDEDAAVASDDEEEEYEYERREATVEQLNEEEKEARARVERRHEIRRKELAMSAADLAAEYDRKAAEDRRRRQYTSMATELGAGVIGKSRSNTVQEGRLLPSINDPSIWRVKCTPGMEKQLVRSIISKCIASRNNGGAPIKINSAFCSQAKATIYIEALAEPFAKEAIAGIRGLYSSSFIKVPVGEMTSLLNISVIKQPLKVGQWARMRRGPLTKDLVQIQAVMDGDTRAIVKAVPRPDYTLSFGNKGKAANGSRPPQRLLDIEEAKTVSGVVDRRIMPGTNNTDLQGTYFDFWNNDYYKDGYLYKEVNVTSYLKADDVRPRLEELQLFREKKQKKEKKHMDDDDEEDEDDDDETHNESVLNELAEQIQKTFEEDSKSKVAPYVPGDLVQVTSGESKSLVGRITAVNEVAQTATIIPFNNIINEPLEVEMKILTKYIYPGAHVKVISGTHMGQTGRVVSLKNKDDDLLAVIITDGVNTEILIKTTTLQITNEVSLGLGNLMGYELYDLVALNDNEIAIVLKVGSEKLFVMNHLGSTKYVLPLELQGKRNTQSQRSKAFDSENTTIVVGDSVRLKSNDDGFTGLGTVKHINKGTLWIHSNQYLKNSGVCVVRARNCIVAGNKAIVMSNLNPYSTTSTSMGPPSKAPSRNYKNERSSDIGKTVRIIKGNSKGLLAQVYAVNGDTYLVELLAKMKKMTVPRTHCTICGDKNGSIEGRSQNSTSHSNSDPDIGTPFLGSQTPMYGGETPRWGSATTPLHTPSQSTPSHNSDNNDVFRVTDRDREYLEDPVDSSSWGGIDSHMGPSPSIASSSNSNYKPMNSDRPSNYTNDFSAGTNSTRMSETPRSDYGTEGRSSKITYKDWVENMIVVIKTGRFMGQAAVLIQKPNERSEVRVQIRDNNGRLEPGTQNMHCNDLSAAEPRKGDKVCFLSGKKKGEIGEFKGFVKSDAVVTLNGKDTLNKIDILAAMHSK